MRIYGYGDQGIDDSGYGCVYRNLQSLMSLFTKSIPTIPELRELLGIPFSRNARRMWIEPPEAEELFRALVPHVPTKSVIYAKHKTPRFDLYPHRNIYRDPIDFHNFLCSSPFPVLVDNGQSSYLVLACDQGRAYIIGDPHIRDSARRIRRITRRDFYSAPLWMGLTVFPNGL